MTTETIVLGGGCFWCTEAIFQALKGVVSVRPGYAGGQTKNPSYQTVSQGTTGHAEVIEVRFRSPDISLRQLLTVFLASHDPTQINRQGADIGPQYRSLILCSTATQQELVERMLPELAIELAIERPLATKVRRLTEFYPAEAAHRDYYVRNRSAPYCQVVINPKLAQVRRQFATFMTPDAQKHLRD